MRLHVFGNSHVWCILGGEGQGDVRLEREDGGLELVGWKLGDSGATAYGLMKRASTTRAGEKIVEILDLDPDTRKDILMVFGEVDVTEHIGRHGVAEEESVVAAVARYVEYLRSISSRSDVGMVLVASCVPHKAGFRGEQTDRIRRILGSWCRTLEGALTVEPKLEYVDWHDTFPRDVNGDLLPGYDLRPDQPNDCHLNLTAGRSVLMRAIRSALLRYDH